MASRIGFVSTYPPTQCGLATFTASLNLALTGQQGTVGNDADEGIVVRLVEDAAQALQSARPGTELIAGDQASARASARLLNSCDTVILQHEFGIYGGRDGEDILRLLGQLQVPTVVVLHTVLTDPTRHQQAVLQAVVAAADAVVTMTAAAHQRLIAHYEVDTAKVRIIAHGAPAPAASPPGQRARFGDASPLILTWGLIGPGKGIEWAVDAMGLLADLRPVPRYLVAGQTHPKVRARDGEAYRDALTDRIRELDLSATVRLDGQYRDLAELTALVASADVVLLPYDSTDQVTSGVLTEAVAAGKPVVATRFPHARELLGDGTGIVVAHRDPGAIAAALRRVLTSRDVAAAMAARAAATTAHLLWPAVADQYRDLLAHVVRERIAA
jgi:polysaccharide biosynthesis protein PslF